MALSTHELRDLLLTDLSAERARELLRPVGFADPAAARARLLRIAGGAAGRTLLADALPVLLVAMGEAARPDAVLVNFERFAQSVLDPHDLFVFFREYPRAVEILVRIFAGSQFLTEIMLCNPEYLQRLSEPRHLADVTSVSELLEGALAGVNPSADLNSQLAALRHFQRWEMLRIGVCDFFGLLDLRRVTLQLSHLAAALVRAGLCIATGCWPDDSDSEDPVAGFSVLALGKLGGEELNYSSDIDLVFLSRHSDHDHVRYAQKLTQTLSKQTDAGFLYRVDLRLRPWGSSGPLVAPLESHVDYLRRHARVWEKQTLLKARVVAGDVPLAAEFLQAIQPCMFSHSAEEVRDSIRKTKQRIEEELRRNGKLWGEVKLGQGSLRDVEFVVQYLQLTHGGEIPAVRSANTLDGLVRLADFDVLAADEYRLLSDGYVFLRGVEHALQLLHNKQTHELPADADELSYLARRLDFASDKQFLRHYRQHCEAIRSVFERRMNPRPSSSVLRPGRETPFEASFENAVPERIARHLSRLEESYSNVFTREEIDRHAELADQLTDQRLVAVDAVPVDEGDWRITIVGYDYHGELSLICGLLAAYGFNIRDGRVFTYQPSRGVLDDEPVSDGSRSGILRRSDPGRSSVKRGNGVATTPRRNDGRQKIVDVFTVRSATGRTADDVWMFYEHDLQSLLCQLEAGQADEAQRRLVKRVAAAHRDSGKDPTGGVYPLPIQIDNTVSESCTVLRVVVQDTVGFLYELTNSLALHGIYIARLDVGSATDQIVDTLYVTDRHGRKITEPRKQWELQAATGLIKHFTHLLPRSPNPEAALINFREFLAALFQRPDWPDELASLERTDVLDALARLLGVSDFLWTDFLRMQHANLFPVVRDVAALDEPRTATQLNSDLQQELKAASDPESRREALNAFKDREAFRADMRFILGRTACFEQFSNELTLVAEAVFPAAIRLVESELRSVYGEPRLASDQPCPWCVCALGKFGGRELGFASDIELMFLYAGEGRTLGSNSLAASEYFIKLVESVSHAVRAQRERMFQIDLRLRPYGKAGTLAVSYDAFRNYFCADGPAWPYERQALVKLRPIAGDPAFGRQIVSLRDRIIYSGDAFDAAAMRGMRERQVRQLTTSGAFNAKLSPGGLVDIEYLVQGLQITYGHLSLDLRDTNTLNALETLSRMGVITSQQSASLRSSYLLLRRTISALRVVRGHSGDLTVPPDDSDEFAFLAHRMGYESNPATLRGELVAASSTVESLSRELLP